MTPKQASSVKVVLTILGSLVFISPAHADGPLVASNEQRVRGRNVRASHPVRQSDQMATQPVSKVPEPVQGVAAPSGEDEFDSEFGAPESRKSFRAAESVLLAMQTPAKPISVYIPPAPGVEIPDSLQPEEIMQVVVGNRRAILDCAAEQKQKDARLLAKIVMQWTILPSGRTAEVSCASDELKDSYLAQCVASLIKTWKFPEHKLESEPINVPFTF
jgi:hypothetical protein